MSDHSPTPSHNTGRDQLTSHEYDGIQEYDNPTPGWWHAIFVASIVFSIFYFMFFQFSPAAWTPHDVLQQTEVANLKKQFAELGTLPQDEATMLRMMNDPKWLIEVLLTRAGLEEICARLTVIAGPKVYSDAMRRFSSLCFGTIKTPQPSGRSSDEAVMKVREVARLALHALRAAEERKSRGDAILVFAEGTRSRTCTMQRSLPAIVRYFEDPGVALVPVGISGSERLVPIGEERAHLTVARACIGRTALSEDLSSACSGNRKLMMDTVGVAIARLLPPEYQGVYAPGEPELDDARRIATDVFGG